MAAIFHEEQDLQEHGVEMGSKFETIPAPSKNQWRAVMDFGFNAVRHCTPFFARCMSHRQPQHEAFAWLINTIPYAGVN
eukprot:s3150_g6.t1